MKRRMISILLSLCMIFSLFPVSAFTLTQEEELYEQMLDLGLVDEDGNLIEDNTFTVEDGTKLGSLDALVQWLDDCGEAKHNLLITVDRTKHSATAAQIAQALTLEYDMADVVSQISLLASGDGAAAQTSLLTDSQSEAPAAGQAVKNIQITATKEDSVITAKIELVGADGNTMAAPCDIGVAVGLFGGAPILSEVVVGDLEPGLREFKSFTIKKGQTDLTFQFNPEKYTLPSLEPVWNGSEIFVLNCHTTSGMRSCGASYCFGRSITLDIYNQRGSLTDAMICTPNSGDDGGYSYIGSTFVHKNSAEVEVGKVPISEKTVDGTKVYSFTIPETIVGAVGNSPSTATVEVSIGGDLYQEARRYNIGNDEPSAKLTGFILSFDDGQDISSYSDVKLYCVQDDKLVQISVDGQVAIKAYSQGTKYYIHFLELDLPYDSDGSYSQEFALEADWSGENHYKPIGYSCYGNVQIMDTTAPTVEGITMDTSEDTFYPGEVVPITVTFSEPVSNACKLYYQDGDTQASLLCEDVSNTFSRIRTFLYKVQESDTGSLQILGVGPADSAKPVQDLYKNALVTKGRTDDSDPYCEFSKTLTDVFGGGKVVNSINTITATVDNPYQATVTVKPKTGYEQLWVNWSSSEEKPFTAQLVLDGKSTSCFDLTMKDNVLSATIDLTDCTPGTHYVELYLDGTVYYGAYATFTQPEVTKYSESSYTITASSWPSHEENVVFLLDQETPTFTAVKNASDNTKYTFSGDDQFYWEILKDDGTSGEDIFTVSTGDTSVAAIKATLTLTAKKAGTAYLRLMARNGAGERTDLHTPAAEPLKITVVSGGEPGLVIPANADTVYTRRGEAATVSFSANLTDENKNPNDDGTISVALYEGDGTSGDAKWTTSLARGASFVTIPGEELTTISIGDKEAYTLKLSATAMVSDQVKPYTATAKIVVRSQPAAVKLDAGSTQVLSGREITVNWTLSNFDPNDGGVFRLSVEKDGEVFASDTKPGEVAEGDATTYNGALTFMPDKPAALKDRYIVTAKAKTNTDPTWTSASLVLTVYQDGSLNLLVNGEDADTATLKNEVSSGVTTTAPSITNVKGKTITGLTSAEAIAQLRSELSLMESIQVDTSQDEWGIQTDKIKWSTTTGEGKEIADELSRAVTINYRNGLLYEPLEKFSAVYYIPQAVMMLCGMRDGTNTVIASHNSVDGLSDSVTVNVERLKDQLYLFQFTPAATTILTYEDGKGKTHTVTSNDDGSLALFEPDGIASQLQMASTAKDGIVYRGSVSALNLKSGEGTGTLGELYPLNTIELRKAAVAEIQIFRPDGTALAKQKVTLRGGVYRNAAAAENRDDAYCTNAKFAENSGEPAALVGTEDHTFTTDENGVLTVHMDLTQFKSKASGDTAVGVGDSLQFIFELRFADNEFDPELVTVNGSLTRQDALRSGANQITLHKADGVRPFVAVQTVDYYTGREMDVRRHTGVVGPSSNYPQGKLSTTVMLWGVSMDDATDYTVTLRSQQTAVSAPNQTLISVKNATYPFSSIPLVENMTPLNEATFANYSAEKKTPLEAVLSQNGALQCTIALPFGLVDMNAVEKVEDASSLLSLMSNLAAYGKVGGADTDYKLVNGASNAILNNALSTLTDLGSTVGLVRSVLLPTEDPTRFEGYFWTGLNTTGLEDLNYDENGISVELSYYGQDYDSLLGEVNGAFTLSDFQAMADGSYFEDPSGIYGSVSSVIGLPIMLQLEGWMSCEVRYNFDKGEWEVLTTGGGFTAGGQVEFEAEYDVKKLPLTFSLTLGGGLVIDFQTAVRYAQQLGYEWDDEKAEAVNDYLTALRINGYIEGFAGVGYQKRVSASIGISGSLTLDVENQFLTRNYLKKEEDRDVRAQYVELNGSLGITASLGVGPIETELTLLSVSLSDNWRTSKWDSIKKYWDSTSSGLGTTGWIEKQPDSGENSTQSLSLDMAAAPTFVEVDRSVHLEDRDYLEDADRTWNENGMIMLLGDDGDSSSAQTPLLSNAYPYSTPQLTDDGSIWVYLYDDDSPEVEDTRVYYGAANQPGYQIDDPEDGFSGCGDSSLDFDGTASFAGAVWLRESTTLKKPAGSELNTNEQSLLLKGLEVVASVMDDDGNWTSKRLTDNGSQELEPVIAVNDKGQAIVAWRSVQTDGEDLFTYEQEQILFKTYSGGKWSDETYVLYNGSSGNVSGLTAELLPDGTAAIAYSLEDSGDVYYALTRVTSKNPEDEAKTILAHAGGADSPVLETTTLNGEDVFILGWHSKNDQTTGTSSHDIGLLAFNEAGAPSSDVPGSLSQAVSPEHFGGQFTLSKGAEDLADLAIVWNESDTGEKDSDILRAVKFCRFDDGSYGLSAAMDAAVLPDYTSADHFDAVCADGTNLQLSLQGVTYDPESSTPVTYELEVETENGEPLTYSVESKDYQETTNLYSGYAAFTNAVTVDSITVDFDSLAKEAYIPVSFAVTNSGVDTLTQVKVKIGSGIPQTFEDLNLRPGQTQVLAAVCKTGSVIENQTYKIEASFQKSDGTSGGSDETTDTVYLDYPDVGISTLQVTEEQEGKRSLLATLYNQSAAAVNKNDRKVVLGVYSDPSCETAVDGKYFTGGKAGKAYEVTLDGSDVLAAIDGPGYAQKMEFLLGQYVTDAGKTEIPDGGVTLFVKARIEEKNGEEWITLPEADGTNNRKIITLESLLERSDDEPVTTTVQLQNGETSSASIQVRNNSLQSRGSGVLLVTLMNSQGEVLESKQCQLSALAGEATSSQNVSFSQTGSQLAVRYADTKTGDTAVSNADAASITLDGLPLTLSDFDQDGKVQINDVERGTYLLTVIPAASGAVVTVDGNPTENGVVSVTAGYSDRTLNIVITAPDGQNTRTYEVTLLGQEGGRGSTSYTAETVKTIKATAGANGSISPSGNVSIREGDDQTFTITPEAGYVISDVKVDSNSVGAVSSYTFKNVSAGHTIEATFAKAGTGVFVDVPDESYYETAVNWAVENGITSGTDATHFTPNGVCTRAQAVTFLWRAAGSPEPKTMSMPFTDVATDSYYYKAVLWAIENGVTSGTSDTTFSPDMNCSRAQIVTFLWRSESSPAVVSSNPFTDVSSDAYYSNAVLWAVKENVTKGTSDTTFSPNANCTRAQIVTFLWRAMS